MKKFRVFENANFLLKNVTKNSDLKPEKNFENPFPIDFSKYEPIYQVKKNDERTKHRQKTGEN